MKTLTVDDGSRIRLPGAKPGQLFAYEPDIDGSIRLVPLPSSTPCKKVLAKLIRKGDALFFDIPKGYTVSSDAIANAVAEERDSRS